jgi:hypothetical protein
MSGKPESGTMRVKEKYSQAARVQEILRTLWTRTGITIGEDKGVKSALDSTK